MERTGLTAEQLLRRDRRQEELAFRVAEGCFDEPECHSFFPEVGPQTTSDPKPEYNHPEEPPEIGYRWERGQRYRLSSVGHRVVQRMFADIADELSPVVIPCAAPIRIAKTIGEMEAGLYGPTIQRAKGCSLTTVRSSPRILRYIINVNCSGTERTVKLKFIPKTKRKWFKATSADIRVSCSCPAWVWWGSEWHAKQKKFLDQKLRGNGSAPDIRDPQRIRPVCKHVYAVFNKVRGWTLTHPSHISR